VTTNKAWVTPQWLALVGGIVFVAAHTVSVIFRDARVDDPAGLGAITLFSIATLLTATRVAEPVAHPLTMPVPRGAGRPDDLYGTDHQRDRRRRDPGWCCSGSRADTPSPDAAMRGGVVPGASSPSSACCSC